MEAAGPCGAELMAAPIQTQSTPTVAESVSTETPEVVSTLFPDLYYDDGAPFPLGGGFLDPMGMPNPPDSTPPTTPPPNSWLVEPNNDTSPPPLPPTSDYVWRLPGAGSRSPSPRATPSPRSVPSPDLMTDHPRRRSPAPLHPDDHNPPTRPTPFFEEGCTRVSTAPPPKCRTPLPSTSRRRPRKARGSHPRGHFDKVDSLEPSTRSNQLRASWRSSGSACFNAPIRRRRRALFLNPAPLQHRAAPAATNITFDAPGEDGLVPLALSDSTVVEGAITASLQNAPRPPPSIHVTPKPATRLRIKNPSKRAARRL